MKKLASFCLLALLALGCAQREIKEERNLSAISSYVCHGGDALAQVSVGGKYITIAYQSEETETWKTDLTVTELMKAPFLNKIIIGYKDDSNFFGGAISEAVLFSVGKDGSGYLAYKSNVYKFSKCEAQM